MSAALLVAIAACFAAPAPAGGNIAYRGGAVLTLSAGNFTGTAPAGIVSGDVMYAIFLQDTGTTSLAGWSADATGSTPTNSFPCSVLRKTAVGTEGGTSISFATGASIGQGVLIVLSGANATTPIDAATTTAVGTAATITWPSITTATDNAWHLAVACNFNALAGTPGGYTPRAASATWVAAFTKNVGPHATVSGITAANGGEWVAFSIAVRSL